MNSFLFNIVYYLFFYNIEVIYYILHSCEEQKWNNDGNNKNKTNKQKTLKTKCKYSGTALRYLM